MGNYGLAPPLLTKNQLMQNQHIVLNFGGMNLSHTLCCAHITPKAIPAGLTGMYFGALSLPELLSAVFCSQVGFASQQPGPLSRLTSTTTPMPTACARPLPLGASAQLAFTVPRGVLSLFLAPQGSSAMPQVGVCGEEEFWGGCSWYFHGNAAVLARRPWCLAEGGCEQLFSL